MATVSLTGAGVARLPRRPLMLSVQAEGGTVALALDVLPDVPLRRPPGGPVIIAELDRPVVVTVRPKAGGVFPAPTVVHLVASVSDPATGVEDRVMLPALDVSGLGAKELLAIRVDAEDLAFSIPGGQPDPKLGPLGDAALVAARTAIGRPRRDDDDLSEVSVVVDASASMRPYLEDGSVRDAVDILTGVAPVIATDKAVHVRVAGATQQQVEAPPAALADAVHAAVQTTVLSTGLVAEAERTARVTFLVTDDVPPSAWPGEIHLVVLAPDDEAGRVLAARTTLPLTVLSTSGGLGARLLSDTAALQRAITGLLTDPRRPATSGGFHG